MSELPARIEDPRLLAGLRLLVGRDYFAAHEALEDPWRELEQGSLWKDVLQGLIQLCVALEHLRRENWQGAFNVWQKSRAKLRRAPAEVAGLEVGAWAAAVAAHFGAAHLAERVKAQLEGGVADGEVHLDAAALPPVPPLEAWPIPSLSAELAARVSSGG